MEVAGARPSGSRAPPEVQRRHGTFGKGKAGVSHGSDILTLPGSKRCCTLPRRHFSRPHLLCLVPHTTAPALSDTLRLSDQGMRSLPPSVATKRKHGRLKLSKPHQGGITGGPILDFKLPQARKKKTTASPLTACPSVSRRPEWNEKVLVSQGCSPAASRCPPVKRNPNKARPQWTPESTQPTSPLQRSKSRKSR